jgi:hypothetical protein
MTPTVHSARLIAAPLIAAQLIALGQAATS